MQADQPSGTAYRVALRRAAHQVFDDPVVFHDPLALRILGLADRPLAGTDLRAPKRPHSRGLRAFVVARSLFQEKAVAAAVLHGKATQYVLLGAGLDTFAYRHRYPHLRVFEVDHPATQQHKLRLLEQHGIAVLSGVDHVPVDFLSDALEGSLRAAGWQPAERTVFAWPGVVPYLTQAAFTQTLQALRAAAPGSTLLLDYTQPRAALPPQEQLALDSLQRRVAATGEPLQLFHTPESMQAQLEASGWRIREDLGRDEINQRWFAGRADGLQVLRVASRFVAAERTGGQQ